MPRGRQPGSISRKPGIFGQTIEKVYTTKIDAEGNPVLDKDGNEVKVINRNQLTMTIEFNDAKGNRFTQVLPIRLRKDCSAVSRIENGDPVLVSEAPVFDEAKASD